MTMERDNASFLEEGLASAPQGAHAEPPRHAAAPTAPAHAVPGSFEPDLHPASPFVEPQGAADADALAELGGEPTGAALDDVPAKPERAPQASHFSDPSDDFAASGPESLAELGGSPQPDPAAAATEWAVAGDSLDLDSPLDEPDDRPGIGEHAARGEESPHGVPPFLADAASAGASPIDVLPDPTAPASPEDTAEIDITAVEAQLSDPGSTQSFEPITDDLIDTDETFDAGTSSMLMWGARSDVGCVRSHNEDSYLVASPLFCVCDGMGGHAAGEVASAIAVETIAKTGPKTADATQLGAAVEAANAAIIEAAVNGVGRPGMGCTATAAVIEGTTLAIAHVGDSRAYLLHEGTLIRVTRDHSYVEELVDAGEITADEARVHPNRSVITRALGSDPAMYADHFTLNVEEGDRLILCSDGLSSMIPDGEIERVAQQSSTAQICTDNLVDAALAAGGGDNVTVVVVDITDDGRARELAKKHRRIATLSAVGLLAVIAIAAIVSFVSITHSVYLGVKDDAVAIYTGVPGTPLGLKLHWLEDETSIELADLPEDTQNRLREGIPQKSLEDASKAVENYRAQIDESKTKALLDARAISQDVEDPAGEGGASSASDAPATADASGPADAVGSSGSSDAATSASTTTEGGAAQ